MRPAPKCLFCPLFDQSATGIILGGDCLDWLIITKQNDKRRWHTLWFSLTRTHVFMEEYSSNINEQMSWWTDRPWRCRPLIHFFNTFSQVLFAIHFYIFCVSFKDFPSHSGFPNISVYSNIFNMQKARWNTGELYMHSVIRPQQVGNCQGHRDGWNMKV